MARKPNYRFERMERERQKAAKKAARAEAKRLEKENRQNAAAGDETGAETEADIPQVDQPPNRES